MPENSQKAKWVHLSEKFKKRIQNDTSEKSKWWFSQSMRFYFILFAAQLLLKTMKLISSATLHVITHWLLYFKLKHPHEWDDHQAFFQCTVKKIQTKILFDSSFHQPDSCVEFPVLCSFTKVQCLNSPQEGSQLLWLMQPLLKPTNLLQTTYTKKKAIFDFDLKQKS